MKLIKIEEKEEKSKKYGKNKDKTVNEEFW